VVINDPDEEDEIQQELLSDDETDSSVHHSGLPERKGQAKVIYLCGGCHQILAENIPGQKLIGCEGRCRKWFHMNCARLTDPDYQHLLDTNTKWTCSTCTPVPSLPAAQINLTDLENIDPTETGCHLPDFDKPRDITKSRWGVLEGEQILTNCKKVYTEIVKWRRNLFLLPSGAVGKQFIEQLNKVVSGFVSKSSTESAAMTMLMIMPALLLQKPTKKVKNCSACTGSQKTITAMDRRKIRRIA
jgi:hypothetical protein